MRGKLREIILVFACAALACSDPNRPDPVDNNDNGQVGGNLHGNAFSGSLAAPATLQNGTLSFNAAQNLGGSRSRRLAFTLTQVTGTGTYNFGVSSPSRIEYTDAYTISVAYVYSSDLPGGSGTVVITTLTATRVAGTYSAALQPVTATGAAEEQLVAGTFDVTIGQ
jgi:hypothetical protein